MFEVRLSLDKTAYDVEAVKETLYRLMDRAAGTVTVGQSELLVDIAVRTGDPEEFRFEFLRELNDQSLRRRIANETESRRNAILALAFNPIINQVK